ncbi:ATP-binding protein [Zhengella mangrovi]|uniref:ATP-binding protein n=2 Tax=Zhengella mangrovi TaxID=1982044 RepID=A0A2G1QHV0_9HYPH|nr:cell envelope integrity EipB family protein [Zhengella mangrovi]PHP65096.1 ATP-binding protein [Zhengella mangrovi]
MRVSLIATLLLAASQTPALSTPQLAPHRAVYDLSLIDASDRSGISGVSGRMVYEFNGSPCDGYTVSFRSVTQFQTSENNKLIDQQVATYENPREDLFTFVTKSFVDEKLDKEVKGTAHGSADGVEVELQKPDEGTVRLSQALFPAEHMIDLLERARKGQHFYETSIFDGTEGADKVLTTTVVIGSRKEASGDDEERKAAGSLADQAYWPVSIAYYDDPQPDTDATPIYRIGFKLYDSGISRGFDTDYGDFRLKGKLVNLEMLDAPVCK